MKGLLVKDFNLLKMQKNFFFMIIIVAIAMAVSMHDITFVFYYLMFIIPKLSLSTISYDEFDNGNAFLFSLPISRRDYIIEKYCFGLLLTLGSWVLATVLSLVFNVLNESNSNSDVLLDSLLILAIIIIFQSIMIPLQIKFGGEKGRIAIFAVVGITIVVAYGVVKVLEILGVDVFLVLNDLSTLSIGVLAAIIIVVTIVVMCISMKISTFILNRKEF